MAQKRDYNQEFDDNVGRKYAYGFDLDVMHPFMIRSLLPFFIKKGSMLELGPWKGDVTRHLLKHFDKVSCVEASDIAASQVKDRFGEDVEVHVDMFETVSLKSKYDNIMMSHVLEHIDKPVDVLKRINNEWLSEQGRFFVIVPNANAPSRQIAVKMGLISNNTAVTDAEKAHGHVITYTLDTLERDVVASGLKVVHRGGIFFKALANFQWDALLAMEESVISPEYLEGCYALGQQYPDLCSSIFLVCEKA